MTDRLGTMTLEDLDAALQELGGRVDFPETPNDLPAAVEEEVAGIEPPAPFGPSRRGHGSRFPWRRVVGIAAALAVAAAAIGITANALRHVQRTPPVTPPPTGGRIVFVRAGGVIEEVAGREAPSRSQIFIMNADGSGLRPLTSTSMWVGEAALSPDGRTIVFSAVDRVPGSQPTQSIFLMSADGTGLTRLTECRAPDCSLDHWPAWSPDGTQVAFVRGGGEVPQLMIMGADGSGLRRVPVTSHGRPVWSPDGTSILMGPLYTNNPRSRPQFVTVDPVTGRATTIEWDPGLQPPLYPGEAAWAPDGSLIAFNGRETSWTLYVMRPDGTDVRQVLLDCTAIGIIPIGGECDHIDVAWSPDSRHILLSGAGAFGGDLYVVDPDGTHFRHLTSGPDQDSSPTWQIAAPPLPVGSTCPPIPIQASFLPPGIDGTQQTGPAPGAPQADRGQQVVHYTDGASRSVEIRRPATTTMDLNGERPEVTVLGSVTDEIGPAERGSDHLIVRFSYRSGLGLNDRCDRYSVEGYGLREDELIRVAEGLQPAGSDVPPPTTEPPPPTGGLIAFERENGEYSSIWTVDPEGGEPTLLVDQIRAAWAGGGFSLSPRQPAWSPDGTKIAVLTLRQGGTDEIDLLELWVMDSDGGNPTTIFGFEPGSLGAGPPVWAPDGTSIAMATGSSQYGGLYVGPYPDPNGQLASVASVSDIVRDADPSSCAIRTPAWSPNGTTIAFTLGCELPWPGPEPGIYVVSPGGTDLRRVGPANTPRDSIHSVAWSPDGASLLYVLGNFGTSTVHLLDLATGDVTDVPIGPGDQQGTIESVAWSTDGTRLVYSMDVNDGNGFDLWTANVAGTDQVRLTTGPGDDLSPSWGSVPS
jgi:Tol biopolymer transport system component